MLMLQGAYSSIFGIPDPHGIEHDLGIVGHDSWGLGMILRRPDGDKVFSPSRSSALFAC